MAKLHFYYSAMNAGKSTTLLQASYNYQERGMETLIYTPELDTRAGIGMVQSRIGLRAQAVAFKKTCDLYALTTQCRSDSKPNLKCVLVDEAQFLTREQVLQLGQVTTLLNIPVLTYGLRTDFKAEPFEGSRYLLALADQIIEIKTICFCGKKATMNLRINETGLILRHGAQVDIGGNDKYIAVCRQHFSELDRIPSEVLNHHPEHEIGYDLSQEEPS